MMTGKMQNRFAILYNICFVFKNLSPRRNCVHYSSTVIHLYCIQIYTLNGAQVRSGTPAPDFPRARKSFGTRTHDIRR